MRHWWGGAPLPSEDAEIIEKLRKDLYEAHKMADLWKKAFEELDEVVKELVNKALIVEPPTRK